MINLGYAIKKGIERCPFLLRSNENVIYFYILSHTCKKNNINFIFLSFFSCFFVCVYDIFTL